MINSQALLFEFLFSRLIKHHRATLYNCLMSLLQQLKWHFVL